jgi:hypothetical protein
VKFVFIDAGGGGGGGVVTDNLVYWLDAGNIGSYSGSGQTWANLVAAPADGSSQTAYDYLRGVTSSAEGSDPTFNGTAGTDPCYFSVTGAQYLTLSGASTSFIKGMHKANAKWTIELWMYYPTGSTTGVRPYWDSGTDDLGGPDMSRGVVYADQGTSFSGGKHHVRIKRDSGASTAMSATSDASFVDNTLYMVAASIDGSGVQNSFLYRNGAYDQVGGADTWDGTFASPGSADPIKAPRLMTRGDATQSVVNGSRLYIVRVYDTNLTKAQLDANYAATLPRFGA